MKRYSNNKKINDMFKNAIDKNALKKALSDPTSKKEIFDILNKIRY